jgi:hypothetical protein
MNVAVILDHAQALAAYQEAGHPFPAIPPGKNTVWHNFTMPEGRAAVIVNQRGFASMARDNDEQVNGCTLAIAMDEPDLNVARAALEAWVRDVLELA